ncbi:hypothetical protein SAMN06265379_103268 [Saccharicrinis carchari]|uniref:Uncharacterized protein n=1 Tax=Saccharicrinis carchari TaxID=1168039 RepID=A0A521CLL0_SACCC|nr:hypothetical protein [Saccharicrinis carchari]SMO60332.1 hypothetical protein SAMN06265379_103268 [Saccharicrinis carchari]
MLTIENYEIWMMDYLDGNLSVSDQALLFQFFEENPHLKEELKDMESVVLCPHKEVFEKKHNILKAPIEFSDLSYPDYVAIKEMEDGLDAEEQDWLSSYINEDKKRAILISFYSKTFLKASQSIRFPLKSRLKRVAMIPIVRVSSFQKIGAAAAIAILLLLGSVPFFQKTVITENLVATNDTPMPIAQPNAQDATMTDHLFTPEAVQLKAVNKPATYESNPISIVKKNPSMIPVKLEALAATKAIHLKTENINAYELGLNTMMPLVIANSLAEKKQEHLAMQSHLNQQSEQLSRSARVVAGGVRVINFLAGNKTEVNRVLTADGQLVAYQVESDNISIRQRIKNKPVTN